MVIYIYITNISQCHLSNQSATTGLLLIFTQKPMKNFEKILVSSVPNRGTKFQKYDFFKKNACFPATTFYMQLYWTF